MVSGGLPHCYVSVMGPPSLKHTALVVSGSALLSRIYVVRGPTFKTFTSDLSLHYFRATGYPPLPTAHNHLPGHRHTLLATCTARRKPLRRPPAFESRPEFIPSPLRSTRFSNSAHDFIQNPRAIAAHLVLCHRLLEATRFPSHPLLQLPSP